MLSVGSDVIDAYLGLRISGIARRGETPSWQPHQSVEAGLTSLFQRAGEVGTRRWGRKSPMRVWLSGGLARPFICGPVEGLKRWTEVLALAEATAADLTGLMGPCTVHVQGWPSPQPTLAVAVASSVRDAIEGAALDHGHRIRSLRPWWTSALNHVLATQAHARMVAVSEGDAMTLVGGKDVHFTRASSYLPAPSVEQASALLLRLAMSAGENKNGLVRVRLGLADDRAHAEVPFGLAYEA